MEHLSQLSGQTMKFMGVEIGEGAMTAADLIEQGMDLWICDGSEIIQKYDPNDEEFYALEGIGDFVEIHRNQNYEPKTPWWEYVFGILFWGVVLTLTYFFEWDIGAVLCVLTILAIIMVIVATPKG